MKTLLKSYYLLFLVLQMPLVLAMDQESFLKKNKNVIIGGVVATGSMGLAAYTYKNPAFVTKGVVLGQSVAAIFSNQLLPSINEQVQAITENFAKHGFLAAAKYGMQTKLGKAIGLATAAGLAMTYISMRGAKNKKCNPHRVLLDAHAGTINLRSDESYISFPLDRLTLMFLNTKTNCIEYEVSDITNYQQNNDWVDSYAEQRAKELKPLDPIVLHQEPIRWFKKCGSKNLVIAYESGKLTYYDDPSAQEYDLSTALEGANLSELNTDCIDIDSNEIICASAKTNTIFIGKLNFANGAASIEDIQELELDAPVVQVKKSYKQCLVKTEKDVSYIKQSDIHGEYYRAPNFTQVTSIDAVQLAKSGFVIFKNDNSQGRYYKVYYFNAGIDDCDISPLCRPMMDNNGIAGYDKHGNYGFLERNKIRMVPTVSRKRIIYCNSSCFESNRRQLYIVQYEDGSIGSIEVPRN